jgi:hypothetical protein
MKAKHLIPLILAATLSACTASVKTAQDFRPINPALYDLIQPYKVTDPAQMPYVYQAANPVGRPLHDDWAVLKDTPRIVTAYRVPLPYKIEDGTACVKHQGWTLWDTSYPTVPGTSVQVLPYYTSHGYLNLPQVLIDIQDEGECIYAVFIGGAYHDVFKKITAKIFGKELSAYEGLHCDTTVEVPDASGHVQTPSDMMCWWPEFALSYVTP